MTAILDPIATAEQWLTPVRLDETAVLFVIGFGDGHVLDALDRRGWSGHVVALEPDAASAAEFLNRKPVREWQLAGRFTVLVGPDYTGLDKVLSALPLDTEKPVIAGNPEVARAHREACVHAARTLTRAWFGARANDEARKKNAGRYLLNTLRNMDVMAKEGDAAALLGAFNARPALVVAAGPSLDRSLHDIVSWRDRVVLIAVDTALRPLLSAGVQPDFVVAVDPSEANACHLTDLPPCPETFLVAEGSLDPEALPHFSGRTFFCRIAAHHPWPWLTANGQGRQQLRAWGSVLTTAFDLALAMGCDPIVFSGADLSYTGGRPYARGTTYEEVWRRAQAWGDSLEDTWAARLAEWPEMFEFGVDGARTRTAPHLRSFRDWIVAEAARAAGRTIINASEQGLLIGNGVTQSTLKSALGGLPVLPRSGQLVNDLHRASASSCAAPPQPLASHVEHDWATFAGVSPDAIAAALRPRPVPDEAATMERRRRAEAAVPRAVERLHPSLSDADNAYLADLGRACTLRLRVFASPDQNLLAELRTDVSDLTAAQALVVVDDVGIGVGAQVRRALDGLLCERPDLWLEYRRFADHGSRVSVIRGGASERTPPAPDADLAKWNASHREVADSLVPVIVREFAPASAIDVGCGAGYWLQALAARGVAEVSGITPRLDGETVVPDIIRAPLALVPRLGRRYDLCLCLEVAQRLAPEEHDSIIDTCVSLSDTVVFSSAPPGAPGASPHDRPLLYWASKFASRGYVLDEALRARVQERWDHPRTVFDCLVAFRRQGAAIRVSEFYWQSMWWASLAFDRTPQPPTLPQLRLVEWSIPVSRLLIDADANRVFRFRSDAARWFAAQHAGLLQVSEDGVPLPAVQARAALAEAREGGWTLWRDEVTVKSSDGLDPRVNGRRYSLRLPAHVAWAEDQPLSEILNHGL